MEESVKRREGLKGCHNNFCAAPSPRFDYYTYTHTHTHPLSGNIRPPSTSNVGSMMQFSPSHQGSCNPAMTPPTHQFHNNYAHGPRMYAPLYNYNSGPQGMPMGNPFPVNQPNCYPSNAPYPNPGFVQMGRPGFSPGQSRGNWISQIPGPDSGRGGHASHISGRGRGHQFAGHGMNPGRGRKGGRPGRGRGQGNSSLGGRTPAPERLFHKSMVEDPWKFCQPVKWKSLDVRPSRSRTHGSLQPCFPKSVSSNTTIVSETCKSRSGPSISLAVSLAASLYETVNENDDDKQASPRHKKKKQL